MAIVVVVALFLVWQLWPAGGQGTDATSPSKPGKGNGGGQGNGNGNGHVGVIVPGENPIEHVIFIVKENRTFDHYFGTYPGADGASEGGTLKCTDNGCVPGPDVPLEPAPYIQPHDITHGFSSGLYAINGGAMNGFNIIGSGQDLSGYVQHSRKTLPNYWAY
ncbi:MAG: alkaline phosphatase family protein, partial [Actinomycetota bacterium]